MLSVVSLPVTMNIDRRACHSFATFFKYREAHYPLSFSESIALTR